jgi:4-hydroxythreonine-4-phosphate dehydrogenase
MHLGGSPWGSELELFKDRFKSNTAFEELNVLDGYWAVRVTSHIALRDVPKNVTAEGVLRAIRFINTAMTAYGKEKPRLAVAALNPHAGEHGLYGSDEEGQIIAPAIEKAKAEGINAAGPFPCDTIFLKLTAGQYDGVVNMYHDQGQIATKLLGFHRGVTYHAGFPAPIATPAHGTAFDIAGRGVANVGATRQAFIIAAKIAGHNPENKR